MTGGQLRRDPPRRPQPPRRHRRPRAHALAAPGINIHDMTLSPQPDFRSGEVALWVAEEHHERARSLIDEVLA